MTTMHFFIQYVVPGFVGLCVGLVSAEKIKKWMVVWTLFGRNGIGSAELFRGLALTTLLDILASWELSAKTPRWWLHISFAIDTIFNTYVRKRQLRTKSRKISWNWSLKCSQTVHQEEDCIRFLSFPHGLGNFSWRIVDSCSWSSCSQREFQNPTAAPSNSLRGWRCKRTQHVPNQNKRSRMRKGH